MTKLVWNFFFLSFFLLLVWFRTILTMVKSCLVRGLIMIVIIIKKLINYYLAKLRSRVWKRLSRSLNVDEEGDYYNRGTSTGGGEVHAPEIIGSSWCWPFDLRNKLNQNFYLPWDPHLLYWVLWWDPRGTSSDKSRGKWVWSICF